MSASLPRFDIECLHGITNRCAGIDGGPCESDDNNITALRPPISDARHYAIARNVIGEAIDENFRNRIELDRPFPHCIPPQLPHNEREQYAMSRCGHNLNIRGATPCYYLFSFAFQSAEPKSFEENWNYVGTDCTSVPNSYSNSSATAAANSSATTSPNTHQFNSVSGCRSNCMAGPCDSACGCSKSQVATQKVARLMGMSHG